uniref:PH domain-containing protein n=1 Tax=Glossina brevipalpis TaxID=37001 RepID=A0A1A9WTL9_9MUSC
MSRTSYLISGYRLSPKDIAALYHFYLASLLIQSEIPEQFCLEYYADRKCRKLKGVIDLDQCEQVDCGLRLENRKQKFQFMFDIKTPKRTYYLAADTETDMRDWVNCICQVCHLHDTKQSQDENRGQNLNATTTISSTVHTSSSNDTTSTSINSSSGNSASNIVSVNIRQSFHNDILRKPTTVVEQQPLMTGSGLGNTQNINDSAYVNTEYTNRETLLCDAHFEKQQLESVAAVTNKEMITDALQQQQQQNQTATAALYLNAAAFQETPRLAVSSNGVVRKIPENLVLNNTPLPETQTHNVQPSPALSTASGPYIPISECFSGSPKFMIEGNNPTTPLNNLDPKFYDTPRSHNNIGLNLTNDQSYSPKITNCGTQQPLSVTKNRSQRSDSDSESVFTDDDEWTHPMPLRENLDRNTRPSDSSVENESFVLTYSQRFSKIPDDLSKEQKANGNSSECLEKLAKVLKNKNNLILDFKENEKLPRDLPQFSDTENTSPAIIGPRDASSVVDESYDIPRSHQLPYYNMAHLIDKMTTSPGEANPIAASTPNLVTVPASPAPSVASSINQTTASTNIVRTLPRAHCYTNAAPSKVEGNVFRYDFMEQTDVPPVNRKLKPKLSVEADKPPEELPAKPPQLTTQIEALSNKLQSTQLQTATIAMTVIENKPKLKPPSVDRKNKPNAFKIGNSNTLGNIARRSTGAPLSMVLTTNNDSFVMETRTLPRQPRPNYAISSQSIVCNTPVAITAATPGGFTIQHQRTASANAAMQIAMPLITSSTSSVTGNTSIATPSGLLHLPPKNEHKLQYFDLDVANAPAINRQSMSISNLSAPGINRLALAADPSARAPVQSSVVYNSVDFVKTEAFKRIREERKKENEGINNNNNNSK